MADSCQCQTWDPATNRRVIEKTARLIHAHLSHGRHNPALVLAFGNAIVEEAALMGGPLAELAAEFGEKLAAAGLQELTKKRKG